MATPKCIHEIDLSYEVMFATPSEMAGVMASRMEKMWLRYAGTAVNRWLFENCQGHFEIWQKRGHSIDEWIYGTNVTPIITFRFEDPSDAMRFKLTWM